MNYTYQFPAVRGIQAGREYYISMVPLKLLSKLFISDDDVLLPEHRAQRKINDARIPDIKNYIIENRNSYVFSALSASINGEFKFDSMLSDDVGMLVVSMNAIFLINDGQHRKAAIEAAMLEDESLCDENISIVFFKDDGLIRSQQMFTDLNKHAVKTSNSLATLYDSRDEIAVSSKNIIKSVLFFKKFVDTERDNLSKNSPKLFTLNSLYKANQRILHSSKCTSEDEIFLIEFWSNVSDNIIEWNELLEKKLSRQDLKETYIITLAITINAFGKLGNFFYEHKEFNMSEYLKKLREIDWMRSNDDWKNRAIRYDSKVMTGESAIFSTYAKIKTLLGIKLSEEELIREKRMMRNR